MAEQFTFFGTWDRVVELAEPEPPAAAPEAVPEPDPRQCGLFEGPYQERDTVERACEALDARAVREALAATRARYPDWDGCRAWPAWADSFDRIAALDHEGGTGAVELAHHGLALGEEACATEWFPAMGGPLRARVRRAVLSRAAARLRETIGPTALVEDGRPAGWLWLCADHPEEAVHDLSAAVAAGVVDGRTRGYLGEGLARVGDVAAALAAYRDAYLIEPEAVDEDILTLSSVTRLLDLAWELELSPPLGAWLPALADLTGAALLPPDAAEVPDDASVARVFAARLASYRRLRSTGAGDSERIAEKRSLLRLCPGLREYVRRLP